MSSLAQLEKQIEMATLAMAKAAENGKKTPRNRAIVKEELAHFAKVVAKSKARLRELEAMKKQASNRSACHEASERKPCNGISIEKTTKMKEPVNKAEKIKEKSKELSDNIELDSREKREEEEGSVFQRVTSFGSQIAMSVSTLGTTFFGTTDTPVEAPEKSLSSDVYKSIQQARESQANDQQNSATKAEKEERDAPVEAPPDDIASTDDIFSLEYLAERELRAREEYIKANRKHQDLKKAGVEEGSDEWKESEKSLRDCYAQVEYWESVVAEATRRARGEFSVASGDSKKNGPSKILSKRRTFKKSEGIDCEHEEAKAREAYIDAMMYHQTLITEKVSTNSEEWITSERRMKDCYANLQHWEDRTSSTVPPTV